MQVIIKSFYGNDDYIVGPHNREMYLYGEHIVENPGRSNSPLFVYGSHGMGKTRFIKSLAKQVKTRFKSYRIVYVDIGNEDDVINMLNYKNTKKKINFLVLDGFEKIGQIGSKDEIFTLINILSKRKRQVVIASDKSPSEIVGLDNQQKNIFNKGKIVKIQIPSFKERVNILVCMSYIKKLELPEEVFKILAHLTNNDIRSIENAVMYLSEIQDKERQNISKESIIRMFDHKSIPEAKA